MSLALQCPPTSMHTNACWSAMAAICSKRQPIPPNTNTCAMVPGSIWPMLAGGVLHNSELSHRLPSTTMEHANVALCRLSKLLLRKSGPVACFVHSRSFSPPLAFLFSICSSAPTLCLFPNRVVQPSDNTLTEEAAHGIHNQSIHAKRVEEVHTLVFS